MSASLVVRSLEDRIRGEFLEMPGLRLTVEQASRLWTLDRATSQRMLDRLTSAGFLARAEGGGYLRASAG